MSHDTIIAGHFATMLSSRGVSAVLSRGERSCAIDRVLLARTDREVTATNDARFVAGVQDVIIRAVDYAPRFDEPAAITEPQSGDQIVVTDGGWLLTLEVKPRSGSQDVAIEIDTRQHWRVYTKIMRRERV